MHTYKHTHVTIIYLGKVLNPTIYVYIKREKRKGLPCQFQSNQFNVANPLICLHLKNIPICRF